jgi:hypothetical protein
VKPRIGVAWLALVASLGSGCAVRLQAPPSLAGDPAPGALPAAPLGGAALADQRAEMERTHRDLVHFQRTLAGLRDHRERRNFKLFSQFTDAFLALHVDPLLARDWQADHAELAALDANLRFMKADVLMRMRETDRAQDVIDEIALRYRGRGTMLVDYPAGEQHPLDAALDLLRAAKWRG